MIYGILTGILWAMETVVLSIVLSRGAFIETKQALFLSPFVSAFLNDAFSSLWLLLVRRSNRKYRSQSVWEALKKKNGRILLLSGLCGGPLGMSFYLLAIKYIGASYTAVISALYPAIGSVIAWIFLKERLTKKQLIGVFICIIGIIGMTGSPGETTGNLLYFGFGFASAIFWGLEGVISSYAMRDGDVSYEVALQIRHGTSIVCYAVLFLPLLRAWDFTLQVLTDHNIFMLLLLTALLETGSYLFYYKAIHILGAAKAMSLNVTYMIWSVIFCIPLLRVIPSVYEVISILVLLIGVLLVVHYNHEEADKVL